MGPLIYRIYLPVNMSEIYAYGIIEINDTDRQTAVCQKPTSGYF